MMHRVVGTEDFQSGSSAVENGNDDRMLEILEGVERNFNDLVQGLSLLGVKRCSHCKQFFRTSDRGRLFVGAGQTVCFECIPAWWDERRDQLTCAERQKTESDLVYWLRSFHNARSYRNSSKAPDIRAVRFELTASCLECHGTGNLGEKCCRYCSGPGTVRIVVPQLSR